MKYRDILKEIYEEMIPIIIKQSGAKEDKGKLYYSTVLPFKNRKIKIYKLKIPTFRFENRMNYYYIFIVHLPFIFRNEFKLVYKQCLELRDNEFVDSYTIFLFSKTEDFIDPMLQIPKRYKIFFHNTSYPSLKHKMRTYQMIIKFLSLRTERIKDKTIFGMVIEDVERLQRIIEEMQNKLLASICVTNNINRNINRNSNKYSNNINSYTNREIK